MKGDTFLKVEGKPFRCPCGANVFRPDAEYRGVYGCNGCGREYADQDAPDYEKWKKRHRDLDDMDAALEENQL